MIISFYIFCFSAVDANISDVGIYGGGAIYKNLDTTIEDLKSSGINEVIIWNLWVETNGDLNFNLEFPVVSNGQYVGETTYPDFQSQLKSLKSASSHVKILTISIGSSAGNVFGNIEKLIESEGTGTDSTLYKNFSALRRALPTIDQIDFDDEQNYDLKSMKQFSLMLSELGYHIDFCPYGNMTFWLREAIDINKKKPVTVVAMHLQNYAGGVGNDACYWQAQSSVPVYPGYSVSDKTPADVSTTLQGLTCEIQGSWVWIYDQLGSTGLDDATQEYAHAIRLGIKRVSD